VFCFDDLLINVGIQIVEETCNKIATELPSSTGRSIFHYRICTCS